MFLRRITMLLIVTSLGGNLSACVPSKAEQAAATTQIAASVFATQTALVPTNTPTLTPSPTLTLTPSPTVTPIPTHTPTPDPILEAISAQQTQQAESELWMQLRGNSALEVENVIEAYQILLILDLRTDQMVYALNSIEQGLLDIESANANIQYYQHKIRMMEYYARWSAYHNDLVPPAAAISEICNRWWLGQTDVNILQQELALAHEELQPLLSAMRAALLEEGSADLSFEQEYQQILDPVTTEPIDALEFESSHDIFQMQRDYRFSLFGAAPTIGNFDEETGYTAPGNNFHCDFNFRGIDGDFLYDFIFPDRTVAVFTNDFGIGQAVERRPLAGLPADEAASRQMVEELFNDTILGDLKDQYPDLRVLERLWIEVPSNSPGSVSGSADNLSDQAQEQESKPLPVFQVVLYLPKASFIGSPTPTGISKQDILRGFWIYVDGTVAYTIMYQDFPLDQGDLTSLEHIESILAGLADLQMSCLLK